MTIQRLSLCLACVASLLCMTPNVIARGEPGQGDAVAAKAFNLRMTGQGDEAMVLLKQSISQDPSYARVQYELSRLYYHRGLGNPRDMESMLKESQSCIESAVKSAPGDVICHRFAGHVAFMRGYLFMHAKGDDSAARVQFEKACEAFKSVVRLNPENRAALLYLVELYGDLPEQVGGDKAMAETYASQLEGVDAIFAAKAHSILSTTDVATWKGLLERHPGNADVLEELGKAHLREGQDEAAVSCFDDSVKSDPSKAHLFLDLSIHHTFSAMGARQDPARFKEHVAAGDAAVIRYLSFKPIQSMQAYALGVQSKYKSFSGDKALGQSLYQKAKSLDPYFSKATGSPLPDLFIPPNEMPIHHRYLMRPY
jgi:tetratricopeptide (TPR) repeat protein